MLSTRECFPQRAAQLSRPETGDPSESPGPAGIRSPGSLFASDSFFHLNLMGKIKPQALLQQSKKKKGPGRISLSSIIACNFVVIVIGLSLYAAYKHWYRRTQFETEINGYENFETTRGSRRSMKFELPTYAILSTPKGSITLELYKNAEPGVVDRFLSLCQDGHFRGAHFYHVINSYVLQVGKNQNSGSAKDWILKTKSDIQLGLSSKHEALMLATTKPNQDGQDFELYITVKPIPDSSDKFIVFGRVRRGEDVIQAVKAAVEEEDETNVSIQSCRVGSTAFL